MNILALDCAGRILTASLWKDGEISVYECKDDSKRHNSMVLPAIDTLLEGAGISAGELDAVACVVGPGSFTGIRVGISTAQALARAIGCRKIEVNTLQAAAYNDGGRDKFAVLLQCRPDEYYYAVFDGGWENMTACSAGGEEQISGQVTRIVRHSGSSDAYSLARFATELAQRGRYSDVITPLYLKKSQAERMADGD